MGFYSDLIRPMVFSMDPEWTHGTAIRAGRSLGWLAPALRPLTTVDDPALAVDVAGLSFPNPIGLAAGYDKSGEAVDFLAGLGFGHVEIGSVSADPSAGNAKPRLFRLPLDQALVVHYGLQNHGADAVAARMARHRLAVPLGVNIVKTNRGAGACGDTTDQILADYRYSLRRLQPVADYLTFNLSCPNTEMGRDFFADMANLRRWLAAMHAEGVTRPAFLKVSPLGGVTYLDGLLAAVEDFDFVSGFIFNLPPVKLDNLATPQSVWADWPGAVSGPPVRDRINRCLFEMYQRMDRDRYRLIGGGGIVTAADAYEMIRRGATMVQLLTALVYQGPGVVRRVNAGLARLLARDGFASITEAVGSAHA